jgi:hypothetical protein
MDQLSMASADYSNMRISSVAFAIDLRQSATSVYPVCWNGSRKFNHTTTFLSQESYVFCWSSDKVLSRIKRNWLCLKGGPPPGGGKGA